MKAPRFLRRRNPNEPGFLKDERGSAIIEFVIVFPMLVWSFLGIFLFWDAFKGINGAQKASFIVADALSRSSDRVTTNYLDGMADLLAYLANAEAARGEGVRLRVTSISWDATNNRHLVDWSYSADNARPILTNDMLNTIAVQIPTLTAAETVILVETEIDYNPPLAGGRVGGESRFYTMGIGSRTLGEFVVIRPRFIPRICLQGVTCPT